MEAESLLLLDFLERIVQELAKEKGVPVSAARAYIESQQYPFLRQFLSARKEGLIQSFLAGDRAFTNALLRLLREARMSVREQLTAFQKEKPDTPLSPQEVVQRALYWQEAQKTIAHAQENYLLAARGKRRQRVHDLIARWVSEQKNETLSSSLPDLIRQADSALGKQNQYGDVLYTVSSLLRARKETQPFFEKNPDLLRDIALRVPPPREETQLAKSASMLQLSLGAALVSSPLLTRADYLAGLLVQGVDVSRTLSIVRVLEALDSPLPLDELLSCGRVFRSLSKSPIQKTFAPLADSVFLRLPRGTRRAILEKVVGRSLEHALDYLQRSLGAAIINTPAYQSLLVTQNTLLGGPPLSLALSGFSKFTGDIFTTIFRGPNEAAILYFEASRRSIGQGSPLGLSPLLSGSLALSFPTLYKTYFDPVSGRWAVGTQSSLRRIAAFGSGAASRAGRGLFGFASRILGTGLLAIGALLQAGFGGLISALSGGKVSLSLRQAIHGIFPPTKLTDDLPKLISVSTTIAIVLLFVLPTFFNPSFTSWLSKTSALLVSLASPEAQGGPVPKYPQAPCVPTSQGLCRWPTAGCISQGPYSPWPGSHRGGAANAIDISASSGTTVTSTIQGRVEAVYARCFDNSGYRGNTCGGGYGNYVVVISSDGTIRLLYGHLSRRGLPRPGALVSLGAPLGNVDQTGNSSGPHLHYQLDSAQHINSRLPFPVPSCIGKALCDAAIRLQSKGKYTCNVKP